MTSEQEANRPQDLRPLKIMVATPVYRDVDFHACRSISAAIANFAVIDYPGEKVVGWELVKSSNLCGARTLLVQRAFRAEATHILWIDSDMQVPEDVIARLLNHNKEIVGANYPTKDPLESRPTADRDDDEYVGPVWTRPNREDAPGSTGLESVSHLGFGCLLTDVRVFDSIELPYFEFRALAPNYVLHTGEDVYCCRKWKQAGFDIWCDHDLSQHIKHWGDYPYDNHNAWFCKETKKEMYDLLPSGLEPKEHEERQAAEIRARAYAANVKNAS